MTRLYNRKTDQAKRTILRKNMTEAEKILWENIRRRQVKGYKFRRQYSVGGYFIDFYSPILRLAIEVDGGYHSKEDQAAYDKDRQYIISSLGIKFLRFSNDEIYLNIKSVVQKIKNAIK